MICYINRSTVDYDIRLQKYVQSCIDSKVDYIVISWDRMKQNKNVYANEVQYKIKCPYGEGRKNIWANIGWCFFVFYQLLINIRKYKVIHACNVENALLAYLFKFFGKKLIIDIYDSVNINIERFLIKKFNAFILPHPKRFEQLECDRKLLHKMFIVENVPQLKITLEEKDCIKFPGKINLSYVGVLQKNIRGLENILTMVKNDEKFILNIAGVGDGFDEILKQASLECKRIKYYGKVQYSDALKIMKNSDFILALYYTCIETHKYASPNKYYEALYLEKPIITSENTLVGSRVIVDNIGYVVKDSLEDLVNVFSNISTKEFLDNYMTKKNNCRVLWNERYKNYYFNVIVRDYHELIKEVIS